MSDLGTRLDWVGAVWLTLLTLNWLIRWRTKIPGRYISLSGWLIILNGIMVLRWPRMFGANPSLEIEYATRFIVYIASTWLQILDWLIYRGLTHAEKETILEAMSLLKRKKREPKKSAYVKREDHDAVVAQLAALEQREVEKKNDERIQ